VEDSTAGPNSLVQHLLDLELEMLAEDGPAQLSWVRRRQHAVLAALDIGRHGQAMSFALRALELAGELGDPAAQAGAHVSVALIYSDNYDVASADHHFTLVRQLAGGQGDAAVLGRVITNLAHHLLHGRSYLAAYQELEAQADLFFSLDDPPLESVYHVNMVIACVHLQRQMSEQPEPPTQTGLPGPGSPSGPGGGSGKSRWMAQIGRSAERLQQLYAPSLPVSVRLDVLDCQTQVALLTLQPQRALASVLQRIELARQADSRALLGGAHRQLGQVWAAQWNWAAATEAYSEALRICDDGQQSVSVMELREDLAAAYASSGDLRSAYLVQRGSGGSGLLMEQVLRQRAQIGAVERQALEAEIRASVYREASERDFLTGVANRAQAMRILDGLQCGANSGELAQVALAIFDLDHFKSVNDRYGHEVGDQVLVAVAQQVQADTREQDWLSRHGGEEFLLILQGSPPDEAAEICERLRHSIESLRFSDWPRLRVTASFGVSALKTGVEVQTALRDADAQLYRAKHAGRNRVSFSGAPDQPSTAPGGQLEQV
jgi:diguanylate cyclase (GGDEF)-like protein